VKLTGRSQEYWNVAYQVMSERGASRSLPRAAGISQGWNRLPTAATLACARAAACTGRVNWAGTVLWAKLLTVALARAGAAAGAGLVDRSGAVLRPKLLAIALALLLARALTLVRIPVAVLAEARGIKRED
jgi:hypothetical protein